jgi:hypothetical protein
LKPFIHQQVLELEEEQTEKSALMRRKSFKRVSFGQNEVKLDIIIYFYKINYQTIYF